MNHSSASWSQVTVMKLGTVERCQETEVVCIPLTFVRIVSTPLLKERTNALYLTKNISISRALVEI